MTLRVLTIPHCASCTRLASSLDQLKLEQAWKDLTYEVLDVTKQPNLASQYQMTAAPTIVFPDESVYSGNPGAGLEQLLINSIRVVVESIPYWGNVPATATDD